MIERTFDRLVEFDEASKQYPIRTLVTASAPRSYTWSCDVYLDQGREGACVGFGWSHEAAARPDVRTVTYTSAMNLYRRAKELDQWAGTDYEGTSVLAGAKAAREKGYLSEFRWAFGLEDLIMAVGYKGPAVLGLNWYPGMYEPDANGFLRPTGTQLGGHCLIANGVSIKNEKFRVHNSWGPDWGLGGDAFISFDDMRTLLRQDGEACIPVVRG